MTIIQDLGEYNNNHLWMKREDLFPFSFGGNKARKAQLFFEEIEDRLFDCVVTYGTSSSNHCRIIANECSKRNMECYIVSPQESFHDTFNRQMTKIFNAHITMVPISDVHDTIERIMSELNIKGRRPYFIEGGGHGNIGTEAYVQCYNEIRAYEDIEKVHFDYIFHASGTGTTQAGLICGKLLNHDNRNIVGISIARKNPRGREVILDSIRNYIGNKEKEESIQNSTLFVDDYSNGYGEFDKNVLETIKMVLRNYGIALDATYTGKAFMGMTDYIKEVKGKNILFIHTGGVPLFFDILNRLSL